jgi:hypothetical protein
MKFLTLFIVVLSAVMFTGCEKQFLSPIKEPIMECITEESIAGIPYEVTEILVRYDEETWMQQTFPISAVNEFLISKGYTPKVKEMDDADRTEIIVSDFDFRPVIEELTTIPGVVSVRPHNEYLDAFKYDPGVILVAYNEKIWQAAYNEETWREWASPITSVHNFLICKGYTPKVVDLIPSSHTEVIAIGHWNIFPIMEELAQLPEVEYVQPNFLYYYETGDEYQPEPLPEEN